MIGRSIRNGRLTVPDARTGATCFGEGRVAPELEMANRQLGWQLARSGRS